MACYHSPRIVTDGLVLHLDVANNKSFKGEPTVNLATSTKRLYLNTVISSFVPIYCSSVSLESSKFNNGDIMKHINTTWNVSTNKNHCYGVQVQQDIGSNIANKTFTVGVWAKGTVGYYAGIILTATSVWWTYGGGSINFTCTGEWQFIEKTVSFTEAPGTSLNFRLSNYGPAADGIAGTSADVGAIIYWSHIQIEEKTYSTPFVDGTRGTTVATGGGLGDLSGNSNHGELVNGPIYNSSNCGSLVFDGVDDYITGSLMGVSLDSGCTLECFIKRPTTPTDWRTYFNLKPSAGNIPFVEFRTVTSNLNATFLYYNNSNYFTNSYIIDAYHYFHLIGIYNKSIGTISFYVNGNFIDDLSNVPDFAIGLSPIITIGRAYDATRNTNIIVSSVKIYNRALSVAEIQQNYNALKSRFNL